MATLFRSLKLGHSIGVRRCITSADPVLIDELKQLVDRHGRLTKPAKKIGNQDCLISVGLKSFAAVQLLLAIEERFDVEIEVSCARGSSLTFQTLAQSVYCSISNKNNVT